MQERMIQAQVLKNEEPLPSLRDTPPIHPVKMHKMAEDVMIINNARILHELSIDM